MIDYLGCIIIRLFSFTLRRLPLSWGLLIGRILGRIAYLLSSRRRRIGLANLRMALAHVYSPQDLRRINRKAFENLGMDLIELFRFPKIDQRFLKQFVRTEHWKRADEALKQGKGLIFLGAHFGNWELIALATAMSGYPLQVLAREQKHTKLNELLNSYRRIGGAEVIPKGMPLRHILRNLKNNRALGMLADQDAGRKGMLVNFFGRLASTSVGPAEIALRTGAVVLPTIMVREDYKFHRLDVLPPLRIENTSNKSAGIKSSLEQYNQILESYIREYPHQWLWAHKRWKSSPQRRIIILSDGKAGHLRQSQAVAEWLKELIYQRAKQMWPDYQWTLAASGQGHTAGQEQTSGQEHTAGQEQPSDQEQNLSQSQEYELVNCQIVNLEFKNQMSRFLINWRTGLLGPWFGWNITILRPFLTTSSYRQITQAYADFVISCGSGCEAIGYLLAKENNAKGIHILKPSYLPVSRFNLCLIPWHDKPQASRHVLTTLIAPSPVTRQGMLKQAENLKKRMQLDENRPVISVFIGGNTKLYELTYELTSELCRQLKTSCEDIGAQLLITTSRRTPSVAEQVLYEHFSEYKPCPLLIIANKDNIEGAVEGMLGLADIAVVSEDSISMVSEAVSSGRPVVVAGIEKNRPMTKHRLMLEKLQRENCLCISEMNNLAQTVRELIKQKSVKVPDENEKIKRRLKELL